MTSQEWYFDFTGKNIKAQKRTCIGHLISSVDVLHIWFGGVFGFWSSGANCSFRWLSHPHQSSPLPACPCSVVLCSFSMYLHFLSVKLSVVLILLLVGVVGSALRSGYT